MHYINSIAALQQLLFSGPPPPHDTKEKEDDSKKNVHCHITKYRIQAYGDEAVDLYKEIYKCFMCGMPLKELKKSTLVEERIDGTTYTFDNNGCALIFKKLRSVMGEDEEEHTH